MKHFHSHYLRRLEFPGLLLLLGLVVYGCAAFSLNFTREAGRVSALWPANAIVLLFLLKNRHIRRVVPYLLTGLCANIAARLYTSHDPFLITGISLVNSLEIIIVLACIKFFVAGTFNINRYHHLVILGLGACLAPACAGGLASGLLSLFDQAQFLDGWLLWFVSHALGLAVFTPLFLVFHAGEIRNLFTAARWHRTLLVTLAVILVLAIVFYQNTYPILFLPIAVLVLAAFHLGMVGASFCLVLTAMVTVYATTHGHGPLALIKGSLTERILILQLFLAAIVMMTLPVASVVAERLRLQVSFLKAKQDAEEASRAKSDFLTSMSHELRTPLNSILGFAQLLILDEQSQLTEKDKSYVNYILNGGDYLLKLINDVLDLARIEAGKIHLSLRPVNCRDAVKSLITTLKPLALQHGVTLHSEFNESAPALEADDDRLMQVLINLGSNAVKYNRPNGTVTISVTPRDSMVRIAIADTGYGIPLAKQAGLFEPFNRLGAEAGKIEGTGIGLAIAKKLVEAMHGTIGFTSDASGTTFWIELANATPLYKTDANFETTICLQATVLDRTILYIEDNPANIVLMTQMLKDFLKIDVMLAQTVQDGLAQARRRRPDLIITDIHLPDGTGYDLLRDLRADPALAATPVIAVTADAMETTREQIKQAGFNASYTKPFQVANVVQSIRQLLNNG